MDLLIDATNGFANRLGTEHFLFSLPFLINDKILTNKRNYTFTRISSKLNNSLE